MNGNEKFILNNTELNFGILDFWKSKYSNIYNMQEVIAEFLVEKALGIDKAQNIDYWTLYDILYRNHRIEIKQTSYYHSWNENSKISKVRRFGISMANSNYEFADGENKYERQNDIYVFCLNTGETRADSNPLDLDNWEFYVVPTSVINEKCGSNKTIGLKRVREIGENVSWHDIKKKIDFIIDNKYKNDMNKF